MKRGYKFRIYPNEEQRILFAKTFGCCRFVWNICLTKAIEEYAESKSNTSLPQPNLSGYGFVNRLPLLKNEYHWLSEVSSAALQQKCLELGSAFANFFKHSKGYPKLKNKRSQQSFRLPSIFFRIASDKLHVAKSKDPIKVKWSRTLPSKPSSVTISKDSQGRYFASFVCEYVSTLTFGQDKVGVDLGLTYFATLSTGEKIANPRYYVKLQRQLGKVQKQLSRKKMSSNNRIKAKLKIAKIHARIHDQRLDFLHKLTRRLVNENQVISIESLNVGGMIRNRKLSKSIADVGWGSFREQLLYKVQDSQWCNLVLMDTFFPSSHLCSACNTRLDRKLSLKERSWVCGCGAFHDRDINAAQVILKEGLRWVNASQKRGEVFLAKLD